MSEVKMPEPVAIIINDRQRIVNLELMEGSNPSIGRSLLITTTQAEAYADAVRREALEEAAQEVELCYSNNDSQDDFQHRSAAAIRALIPHNDNEQGE